MGDQAFAQYLKSAEDFFLQAYTGTPMFVVAHSFGAQAVNFILQHHSDKIAKVILISPCFSLSHLDQNLFNLAKFDFREAGDIRADQLEQILKNYSGRFDDNTRLGFMTASQSPRFFDYYWFNKTEMGPFLQGFADPGFSVDVEGFLAVRSSWFDVPSVASSIPVVAVFGQHDVVVSNEVEKHLLKQRFLNLKIHTFEKSAHYPHVEELAQMMALMKNELALSKLSPRLPAEADL